MYSYRNFMLWVSWTKRDTGPLFTDSFCETKARISNELHYFSKHVITYPWPNINGGCAKPLVTLEWMDLRIHAAQRAYGAIIKSLLATSFWRNNDVIVMFCTRWVIANGCKRVDTYITVDKRVLWLLMWLNRHIFIVKTASDTDIVYGLIFVFHVMNNVCNTSCIFSDKL